MNNLYHIFSSYFSDNQFRDYLRSIGFVFQEEDTKEINLRELITKEANKRGWFWDNIHKVWYDKIKDHIAFNESINKIKANESVQNKEETEKEQKDFNKKEFKNYF